MRFPPPLAALALLLGGPGATVAGPVPTLDWQHVHDGGSGLADVGVLALADPAGNLVVAGEVSDAANNGNLLIRKIDRDTGGEIWSRSVVGTPDNRLALGGIVWDHHGHLLIGGTRLGCFG